MDKKINNKNYLNINKNCKILVSYLTMRLLKHRYKRSSCSFNFKINKHFVTKIYFPIKASFLFYLETKYSKLLILKTKFIHLIFDYNYRPKVSIKKDSCQVHNL